MDRPVRDGLYDGEESDAVLSLKEKAVATVAIVGMNLLVFLFVPWFAVITAIPSLVLLWAVLTR